MKKSWEYKRIKDIGSVVAGTTPNTNVAEYWDGSLCWISPAELDGSHYLYDSKKKITEAAVKAKSLKLLPEGTVILSSRAPIGKVVINKIPTYCNQGFKCVVCGKDVYNEFLYWWFWGKKEYLNSLGTGATFKEISKKVVEEIIIPVPPLSEQQTIVDYLDSAFAKIDAMKANAEKALNEAKALFQASLKEMLEPKEGWEEKKLMDIGELKNGINFNKNESGYNVHILGVGDFGKLFLIDDTDCLQTISLNSNPSEEYILKNEDIVFVRSNGNKNLVGRCVLIHVGEEPCSFSGFCIRFRKSTNEVDAYYLTHFLKTENARKKLVGNGANISNLNQKVLNEFIVSYPSISEQKDIVTTLDSLKSKVDRLQENYEKISQECDALKQAILRQVFE